MQEADSILELEDQLSTSDRLLAKKKQKLKDIELSLMSNLEVHMYYVYTVEDHGNHLGDHSQMLLQVLLVALTPVTCDVMHAYVTVCMHA